MTSCRLLVAIGMLGFMVGACSGEDGQGASGSGGSSGTGGTAPEGGTTGGTETGGSAATTGGVSSTGGLRGTGGSATGGASGGTETGGTATGGASGGSETGGAATGGASGGAETGGAATGGASGETDTGGSGDASGGTESSGGSSGTAGTDGGEVRSAGCGKTRTLQNGTITLQYDNASRNYILRAPDSYDSSHAYRLVLAYAWSGGSSTDVANTNYFTFATLDGENTIFVAPNASNGAGSWSSGDVEFTDAILAQIEDDLCIDKSRVFATGFSFGGGMAMALACTRADVFRAVAFFSGADLTGSCPTTLTQPIAYYASQASEDANGMSPTNPMTGEMKQAQFAAVNGCTEEPSSTTFPAAGQPHTCTIYENCSEGHPTEYCVFNGPHGWEPVDPGQSTSWNAPEAWKFITQF